MNIIRMVLDHSLEAETEIKERMGVLSAELEALAQEFATIQSLRRIAEAYHENQNANRTGTQHSTEDAKERLRAAHGELNSLGFPHD